MKLFLDNKFLLGVPLGHSPLCGREGMLSLRGEWLGIPSLQETHLLGGGWHSPRGRTRTLESRDAVSFQALFVPHASPDSLWPRIPEQQQKPASGRAASDGSSPLAGV